MDPALAPLQIEAIAAACRRHHVALLHAFGSVLRPDYRPGESDIDFLLEFKSCEADTLYKAYFGLLNDLRQQLRCHVDLEMAEAVRNPYIKEAIDASKKELYAT